MINVNDNTNDDFDAAIHEAYYTTNRSLLWLVANLQCESSELAELVIKKEGYQKEYTDEQLLSEAGDVLNFLTRILQVHEYTLEDAMDNNITKLKERKWIKS